MTAVQPWIRTDQGRCYQVSTEEPRQHGNSFPKHEMCTVNKWTHCSDHPRYIQCFSLADILLLQQARPSQQVPLSYPELSRRTLPFNRKLLHLLSKTRASSLKTSLWSCVNITNPRVSHCCLLSLSTSSNLKNMYENFQTHHSGNIIELKIILCWAGISSTAHIW